MAMTSLADHSTASADGPSAQSQTQTAQKSADALDIAVIVVTYKSAQLTIECLRSVQRERSTPGLHIRAVVVDNASGDLPSIAEAVELHHWSDWVTLVLAPINGGFAYGNNRGIEAAYAGGAPAYFHLLNPDAEVRPGAIDTLARFLELHTEVGIAGSSFETGDGSDWPFAFRFPTLVGELNSGLDFGLLARLLRDRVVAKRMSDINEQVDWVSGSSMMIRPAVISRVGGMDENYFLYFEETDFCRRARNSGFSTWYVPGSRVMHIGGQSTKVTDLRDGLKRLPAYWFASRRRYFAVTFGIAHAMAIDIVALFAYTLGWVKRIALGRRRTVVPHFVRDLLRYSVLWPSNRTITPVKSDIFTEQA